MKLTISLYLWHPEKFGSTNELSTALACFSSAEEGNNTVGICWKSSDLDLFGSLFSWGISISMVKFRNQAIALADHFHREHRRVYLAQWPWFGHQVMALVEHFDHNHWRVYFAAENRWNLVEHSHHFQSHWFRWCSIYDSKLKLFWILYLSVFALQQFLPEFQIVSSLLFEFS